MDKENLALMIRDRTEKLGPHVAMRVKRNGTWLEVSYGELGKLIEATAGGLLELGVKVGDRVGIISRNTPEWSIADFAIQSVGAVSVPIYATSTPDQASYIICDAGIKVMFAGAQEEYEKVCSLRDNARLEHIILMDEAIVPAGSVSQTIRQLQERGRKSGREMEISTRLAGVSPEDIASLVYTSGTTGEPKGVMLSHRNFFHQFRAVNEWFHVSTNDRSLCFLPLSHVYERSWTYFIFYSGAQNNYLLDPRQIIACLAEVRPTVMVSAPRLYEKIYAAVFDRLERAPAIRRKIFHRSIATGRRYADAVHAGKPVGIKLKVAHALADKLVLHKLRDIVGGPKNFLSAGGAPMAGEIEELFYAAGILVCRGYGLTETSPMVTANSPKAFRFGSVGRSVIDCQIKIDDDGEILVRGANVMRGYYNKPGATDAAFRNGWFCTGDIGELSDDGFLTITDRKKDLIITAGGKNIAPQRIETAIGKDHYVEQITVMGDGRKFISALIVPFFDALEDYAERRGWRFRSRLELVHLPEVVKFFKQRIETHSTCLAGFEKIREFRLLAEDFTLTDGEITPTMKIRRAIIANRYKDLIEEMYG